MLKTLPDNPYIIGRPIREPEYFFGREDLFYFVQDNLKQEVKVILLHGQRRIGKSSILAQIPNFVKLKQFVFIPLSLEGKSQKPLYEVLYELAEDIKDQLIDDWKLAEDEITLPSLKDFQENIEIFTQIFLPEVYVILGNKNLVLLLDEFDILGEHSQGTAINDFFPYLQSILYKQAKLFIIPVIGRQINDMPMLLSLFKDAPHKHVGLLDKYQARQLITKPAQEILQYQPDAIEAILELSAGHPYFTQVICFAIFGKAREQQKWEITREDVEQIIPQAIEYGEGGLAWFHDGLTMPERVLFSAIAEVQETKKLDLWQFLKQHNIFQSKSKEQIIDNQYEQLFQAQSRLLEGGYILSQPQGFKIAVELVRLWLLRRYTFVQTLYAYQVYLANQLLDSKFKVWAENKQRSHDLLNWREWRFIKQYKPELNWEDERIEKEAFFKKSKQRFYWKIGMIMTVSLLPFAFLGWLTCTPWGQLTQIRWKLTNVSQQINNPEYQLKAASAFAKDENFKQAFKLADKITEPYYKAYTLSAIAEAIGKPNFKQSKDLAPLLEKLEKVANQIPDFRLKAKAFSDIAIVYHYLDQPTDKVSSLMQTAKDSALNPPEQYKDSPTYKKYEFKVYALTHVAEVYGKLQQEQEAYDLLEKALEAAKLASDTTNEEPSATQLSIQFAVYKDIAETYGKLKQWDNADTYFQKAAKLAEKMNSVEKAKVGNLIKIAESYVNFQRSNSAVPFLRTAITSAKAIRNDSTRAKTLIDIAKVISNLQPKETADSLLHNVHEIAKQIPPPDSDRADALIAIAQDIGKLNQPDQAAKWLEKAIASADKITDSYYKADALIAIAEAIGKLNQPEKAAPLLEKALTIAQQIPESNDKASADKASALTAIATAQANLKNWGQALKVVEGCNTYKECEVGALAKILTVYAEQQHPELKEEEEKEE